MRMKPYLTAALGFGLTAVLWADPQPLQSVILSSSPTEPLRDSKGAFLDDTFTFALGVFANDFDPMEDNTGAWIDNFVPFFDAVFADTDPGVPRFAGRADLMSDGSSSALPGSSLSLPATGFFGMDAWLWVYNGTTIQTEGTEWFLGRANDWVFPTLAELSPVGDCVDCPGSFPIQWALSNIFETDPVWGRRENQIGAGFAEYADELIKLQTYAIPEPRTYATILALLSAFILLPKLRRRRQ